MTNELFFLYLLVISGSTYLVRAIPFAAARRPIENRFVRSFLHYIPCAVLTAMTIPSALYATGSVIGAAVGLLVAVLFAVRRHGLTAVAVAAVIAVYVTESLLTLLGS